MRGLAVRSGASCSAPYSRLSLQVSWRQLTGAVGPDRTRSQLLQRTVRASRSTIHGTLVKCARAPVIGPATPKPAASISEAFVEVSRRKCMHTAPRSGKSSVRYDRTSTAVGRHDWPRRKSPRKIFVPPTSPASSMARLYGGECLTSTRALLHRGQVEPTAPGTSARRSGRRIHGKTFIARSQRSAGARHPLPWRGSKPPTG